MLAALTVVLVLATRPAWAYDPSVEFARGTVMFSLQAGGGAQEFTRRGEQVDLSFVNVTPRLSILPLEPFGPGWLRGTVETGIEGWVQQYLEPQHAIAGGLKAVARYHILSVGRLVPYVEATAGVGGSSLRVLRHHSPFTFVLEGGAGLSYFVADGVALTTGYRFQHLSNAGMKMPNRPYDAHTGTLGISFFFH